MKENLTKAERIARLNDEMRRNSLTTGIIIETQGILAITPEHDFEIRRKVAEFDAFTEENDPHGERDFGAFEHDGHKIFWKIDYYAKNDFTRGSERPESDDHTMRVLTVMLAEEY